MEKGIELWKKVLTTAMQLPYVKVNRDSFLKKELVIYCSDMQLAEILAKGTIGVIPIEILDKIASECINYHVKLVTASSTALGILMEASLCLEQLQVILHNTIIMYLY